MTKYFLSNRLAHPSLSDEETRDVADKAWQHSLKHGSDSHTPAVSHRGRLGIAFHAEPGEVDAKRQELQKQLGEKSTSVIVEKEIPQNRHHPIHNLVSGLAPAVPAERKAGTLTVNVLGGKHPLPDANVSLVLVDAKQVPTTVSGKTNHEGVAKFTVESGFTPVMYFVQPRAAFWGMVVQSPGTHTEVVCPPLPQAGPLGWWHHAVHIGRFELTAGQGITIGVIDTGVGPNPSLSHVKDAGAIIDQHWSKDGRDVGSHGTMSCGIIGARPVKSGEYGGVAPGANVLSVRVYPNDESSANQLDVAMAIDLLSTTEEADLINLSLYSMTKSEIQEDAIRAALKRGTLCVCSAGNDSGPVGWPARFPETIAVSGLGKSGAVPKDVVDAVFVPASPDRFGKGGYYLAKFSSFGPQLTVGAPAVGIISTVPVPSHSASTFNFVADSGTSEASPITIGVLARLMSGSAKFRQLPRTGARPTLARELLAAHVADIGLAKEFTGEGLPIGE